jgi:formylglycine-generating enzyme required for sulfatase activity
MAGEALDVFISYSHQDEDLKDELVNYHLKLLQRDGKINTWQDRDIEAGAVWDEEIRNNLDKADIILMLVTRHFLASDYCYGKEMMRAIKRHEQGTARVISVILSPCSWQYTPFQKLQVLPKDGNPVTRWADKAEAFLDVELGIRRVVDSIIDKRQEQERRAAEQRQREQVEAARREQERLEEERKEQARLAEERRQQAQAEAQRRKQERLAQERQEQERLAAEQRKQEKAEARRIEQERQQQAAQQTTITSLPIKTFEFEVVALNDQGQEKTRTRKQAQYFTEDLGNGTWLDMVLIPGGSFMMGSPDGEGSESEKPQHQVTVQPFCMGKFAVTQAQWRSVAAMPKVERNLEADPSRFKGAMRPVEQVSWHDAVEFCQRLSRYTNRQYRLPSEAEWEYACRAGTTTPFHFGLAISRDFVNCKRNLGMALVGLFAGETTEVGRFNVANDFGLYDMHGNVREWCQDFGHGNYKSAPTNGLAWIKGGNPEMRVVRGGSFRSGSDDCRSAHRFTSEPDSSSYGIGGFRVVCGGA